MTRLPIPCVIVCLALAGDVAAQETRQEIARQQRLDKSRTMKPFKPGKAEAVFFKLSNDFLLQRLFDPEHGFFVRAGTLVDGGGFAVGGAWRASGARYQLTVTGGASIKGYWLGSAILDVPRLADGRLFLQGQFLRAGLPQEDYFGLGRTTRYEGRTSFALYQTAAGASGGVRFTPWLAAGGGATFVNPDIGRGTDPRFPSTEEIYTDETAPGLSEQPTFMRYDAFVDLDYRDSIPSTRTTDRLDQPPLSNARSGGRYLVRYSHFRDRELDRYTFNRFEIDLQQHLPFLYGHRVLALRARLVATDSNGSNTVPFYYRPFLGGTSTLRGFRNTRFRDENALLLQAEYRVHVNNFISTALFVDGGQVARQTRDLRLSDLEGDYGVGVRLGLNGAGSIRADVAFGSGEGTRFLVGFSNVF